MSYHHYPALLLRCYCNYVILGSFHRGNIAGLKIVCIVDTNHCPRNPIAVSIFKNTHRPSVSVLSTSLLILDNEMSPKTACRTTSLPFSSLCSELFVVFLFLSLVYSWPPPACWSVWKWLFCSSSQIASPSPLLGNHTLPTYFPCLQPSYFPVLKRFCHPFWSCSERGVNVCVLH